MGIIDLQYLSPDDLVIAKSTDKRSDRTAVDNIRAGAFSQLHDLDGVRVTLTNADQEGVIRLVCDDKDIGRLQVAVAKRARHMVPRGHVLGSRFNPELEEGAGI